MKLRHPYCQNTRCSICMEDHTLLGEKLDELTGNDFEDHLGKYHLWLSKHKINPETEFGWATPEAFDDENIKAYVEDYKEKYGL